MGDNPMKPAGPDALAHHLGVMAAWRAKSPAEQLACMLSKLIITGAPARRPGDRIRIGIVSPCCYLGGAEKWISDLLDLLDMARVEIIGIANLIAPGDHPTFQADWSEHAPVTFGIDAIADLARRVDVMVTWGVLDVTWGISPEVLESIMPRDLTVITVSHCSIPFPPKDPNKLSRAIPVAVSKAAVRGLPDAKQANCRIITNAISPDRVARSISRAEMHAEWGLAPGTKVMGWLGRLSHEKGPEKFIRAAAVLPPEWTGVMVGWGTEEHIYREIAAREAPTRIVFAGSRTDVGNCLGAYDTFVMASMYESCSLALGEAMLAGVPTISPPVGELEERPELSRLVPHNPGGEEIAAAVLADQADPDGTARRVELARFFAASRMSPATFRAEWTDFLCSVAPPPGPAIHPAVRDRVNACQSRGPVLPISQQRPGCGCGELSECRDGKGKVPGRVSLRDCLACQGG